MEACDRGGEEGGGQAAEARASAPVRRKRAPGWVAFRVAPPSGNSFSRSVPSRYRVLNAPRSCNAGTTRSTKASIVSGATARGEIETVDIGLVGPGQQRVGDVRGRSDDEGGPRPARAELGEIGAGERAFAGQRQILQQGLHGIGLDVGEPLMGIELGQVDSGPAGDEGELALHVEIPRVLVAQIERLGAGWGDDHGGPRNIRMS